MTNKPMLSVEREVIEKALRDALTIRFDTDSHVTKLRALLDKPAADFNPEHTLFNEIRTSTPVNDESEPLQYLVSEQQLQRIRELELLAAQHQGEPVAWRHDFPSGEYMILSNDDYHNRTILDDEYQPLYAAPAPVADTRQDKEDMLYDCAYRNGVMFGYGIGINGTEDDYQKCINRLQDQIVEARRDLKAKPAPVSVVMPERDALRDLISGAIGGDTYDCTRVWSAWGVGTMSEDDFVPVVEQDERLYEIADSLLAEVAKLNGVKP